VFRQGSPTAFPPIHRSALGHPLTGPIRPVQLPHTAGISGRPRPTIHKRL